MMTRIAICVAVSSVLCLGAGTRAVADPVTITSGAIVVPKPDLGQAVPIAIAGTRGFSMEGVLITREGNFDPLILCRPCWPTTTDLSVGFSVGGLGIIGNVTLDGKVYRVGSLNYSSFMYLQLIGTTALPPVNAPTLVIHAPFTVANSVFQYELTPGAGATSVPLRGRGTATAWFRAYPFGLAAWEFSRMRYDFVVPEPSTLILVGGGLAATLLRSRKRQSRRRPAEPAS
jgi:hypothetical protein